MDRTHAIDAAVVVESGAKTATSLADSTPSVQNETPSNGAECAGNSSSGDTVLDNALLYSCPRFDRCSAPVCPLYQHWPKTAHIRGERVCSFMLEASKAGGDVRLHTLLGSALASPILRVYQAIAASTEQHPTGLGHGEIRRKLSAASRKTSRLAGVARLHAPNAGGRHV